MASATNHQAPRFLGLAVAFSLFVAACGRPPQQMGGPGAVPVQIQSLQPGSFEDSSEFIGSLEAEQRVDLKPEAEGRVSQIFVAAGDRVEANQPLLQLSPDRTQAQVAGAQAGAEAARYARDTAQAQLAAAQSQQIQAQANVKLAEVSFGRTQSLVAAGAQSRQELDNAQNQLEVARATQQRAADEVRAAQAQLRQAISRLNQAEAEVSVNQESLNFRLVTAPIAGMVGDLTIKVGDYVSVGQTITTITQNDSLLLRLQVPATRSAQLQIGLPVELIAAGTGNPLATGSLSFIAAEVDASAQSILVKARFANDANTLRAGQSVQARMIWDTTSALLVPTAAVSRIGGQSFVFVAADQTTEDGQSLQVASQRPVQLGAIQGDRYQVLEGLQAGEQVVVTNILKLQDGVPIQAETAAAVTPGS